MKQIIYSFLFLLVTAVTGYGQSTIKGEILDEDKVPLIGATVIVKGTTVGTVTDAMGKFSLTVPEGRKMIEVQYVGYTTETYTLEQIRAGALTLVADAFGLDEVVVTGVIDLVKDRETPVAASIIRAKEIQLKLGNQEFPEIMKSTPSVYTTKTSGGYGDGRISVRGFDNTNVAIIINGQPINDMENGAVYWSNWAGLQDMASGIEIQRGLGASSLSVPSVGGTINVVTKSSLSKEGGYILGAAGNDGYLKSTVGYNTGVTESGWSVSAMIGGWQGDGYIYGTGGQGVNYLFGMGYQFSEKNSVNVNFIGAGQWHNQRSSEVSIRDYQNENFGESDDVKDGINRKINHDWGFRDGEEFNIRRNFYNKPIASVNWDSKISNNVRLSTSLYGSWGRGGGTGPRGRNFGVLPFREGLTQALSDGSANSDYRTSEGYVNWDRVILDNRSGDDYTGGISAFQGKKIGSNGFRDDGVNRGVMIRRASVNSHNWLGGISNLEVDVNDFTFGLGVDLRSYTGLHYRVLNDLMGLDGYYSTGNDFTLGKIVTGTSEASPFKNISRTEKIDYYNIGKVGWVGVNGLVEYKKEKFSAVLQLGLSNQSYQRIDYFDQLPHESEKTNINGGYVKGGVNYNINRMHNVFVNAGFINRPPFFDSVFPSFSNTVNGDVEAEEITSFEIGYGLRSKYLDAKLNGYYTTWANRYLSTGVDLPSGAEGTAVFSGIENQHTGVEIELTGKPMADLRIKAMASFADWVYTGDADAAVFDDNQNEIGTSTLFIDGAKVGDAAQTTFSLGADYKILEGLSIDATYVHYSSLFADFNILDSEFMEPDNKGAIELPSYGLVDLGLTYSLDLKNNKGLTFRVNVNNLLDQVYISESRTNIHDVNEGYSSYEGISNQNRVWFGFGRTWNASVRFEF